MIGDLFARVKQNLPALNWLSSGNSVLPMNRITSYKVNYDGGSSQVHLRIDENGNGTMFINANSVYHLNPTATLIARGILQKQDASIIKKEIRRQFNVKPADLEDDFEQTSYQINSLLYDSDVCPIHTLEVENLAPFQSRPNAPYRMDLAVTYRCNNDCHHCYNARERNFPELSTEEWKKVIDTVWSLGIPHLVFTGGEPTLRTDLIELITYASKIGFITGMNTNARRLISKEYVDSLVAAGLDHIQITVESNEAEVHNMMVDAIAFDQTILGLKNALATRLYVMTNTTMLRDNVDTIPATLDFLAEIGVPTIGLNALIYSGQGKTVGSGLHSYELEPILAIATEKTIKNEQRLIWYTPTQYCGFDPTTSNLGVKGCTAALYNMCVEPNGDVLPCQSYYEPVGNVLSDPWPEIWNNPLCVSLRERKTVPDKCDGCGLFSECGGGCPLENDATTGISLRPIDLNVLK